VAAGQQWLFAPAQPLVERLGREFFRTVPAQPGVYLMRDVAGAVVYVGKAKNLRQRLQSYRVANPEHVPRRHLRLMREVAWVDFDLCRNEPAALAREARLLRELKPKFNRAGVWPGKARFLTWRFVGQAAEFQAQETPLLGWERFGSMGAYAPRLLGSVVRLLWLALHPEAGFTRLPCGWAQNRFPSPVTLSCGAREAEIRQALESLCWGHPEEFSAWLLASIPPDLPAFDQAAMQADKEEVEDFVTSYRDGTASRSHQLALL
jgi:predicted GIY-YIG superfamily endonuclease